jgi:hypothetical protein
VESLVGHTCRANATGSSSWLQISQCCIGKTKSLMADAVLEADRMLDGGDTLTEVDN